MVELSDFERGQIFGASLAGTSVIQTATVLGVSRERVSKVMSAYTNHEKRKSGRKSTMTEIGRRTLRIVSKNHRTTATQVTAELNIHLGNSVSTKTVRRELHKSNVQGSGRAAIAKPLITGSNAQMRERWCHTHET
jgi:hypothetical protein